MMEIYRLLFNEARHALSELRREHYREARHSLEGIVLMSEVIDHYRDYLDGRRVRMIELLRLLEFGYTPEGRLQLERERMMGGQYRQLLDWEYRQLTPEERLAYERLPLTPAERLEWDRQRIRDWRREPNAEGRTI